ncbi:LOW QUALITY PROTEIN: hypothetical protein CVT25_008522 [Psilocybe cyanescens]|uniref:Uncharacterized protein n=1 Tax=Psilocybe cyanescens TaxID=93625 RepID=A0A409XNQ4_PSICY|nr:LOW QUALITY PROTEIN: hypothetical protein CVT25_008522 [Psilocybe cyanescens]
MLQLPVEGEASNTPASRTSQQRHQRPHSSTLPPSKGYRHDHRRRTLAYPVRKDISTSSLSIEFPNPQLASPYAQVPQYVYRPSSIPIESSFADDRICEAQHLKCLCLIFIISINANPHVAQNVYSHQQQQPDNHYHAPSTIHSARAAAVRPDARPDALVAIDPFHTQRRDRKDGLEDPSTFDTPMPVPASVAWSKNLKLAPADRHHHDQQQQQQQQQPFNGPSFMEAGAVVESSGSRVISPGPINQLQEKQRSAERVGRRHSSDGHVHDPAQGLLQQQPPPTTTTAKHPTLALAPVRRRTIPDIEQHHKAHTQEGSLENYESYSWKQPPLSTSSHSHSQSQSHSNSYAHAYAPNANGSAAPMHEIRRSSSFWPPPKSVAAVPQGRMRNLTVYRRILILLPALLPRPSSPSPSPSSGDAGAKTRPRQKHTYTPQTRIAFIFWTLPTLIYIRLLLGVPAFYFTQVARVFEEGGMTMAQIERIGLEGRRGVGDSEKVVLPPGYRRLRVAWEAFVDGMVGEWKMVGVVSVLLLSAILTTLQIESANANTTAAGDLVIRYTALLYVLRFGTMRKLWKAVEWALAIVIANTCVCHVCLLLLIIGHLQEAKKDRTKVVVWWNVWVMLAMPVVWLAWSIILYVTCIMTFVWRTSSRIQDNATTNNAHGISDTGLLVVRIVINAILGLGIVYMGWRCARWGGMGVRWICVGGDVRGEEEEEEVEEEEEEEEKRRRGHRHDLDGHQSWRPGQPAPSFVPLAPSTPYGYGSRFIMTRIMVGGSLLEHLHRRRVSHVIRVRVDQRFFSVDSRELIRNVIIIIPPIINTTLGLGLQQGTGKGKGQGQGNRAAELSESSVMPAELNTSTLSRDPKASVPVAPQESEDPGSSSASASVRKRTSLAVPLPASLPHIPGTPMSGSGSGLSGPRSRSRSKSLQTTASATFTTTSSVYANRDRSSFRYYSGCNLDSRRETTSLSVGVEGVHADADADADADTRHAGGQRIPTRMASVSTATGSGGSEYLGSEHDIMQEEEPASAQSRAGLSNDEAEVATDASISVPRTPVPSPATVSPR